MSGFAFRLAWRELRGSARRIGIYMAAIALGVAALVAVNSLRSNVLSTVRGEARELMGADMRLRSSAPLSDPVRAVVDSLADEGARVARVVRMPSMVLAESTGAVRLLQLQALNGGYPFYGSRATEPAGLWPLDPAEQTALVDPAVLVQLGMEVGDTLVVGESRFRVAGTVSERVGEVGLQSAVGPRVYIHGDHLAGTGLARPGSLVDYETYIAFDGDGGSFLKEHEELFREERVRAQTAQAQVERLVTTVGSLGSYLSLVGLAALLLGGVAVASAVNLFVEERLTAVAVLRCIGAGQGSIFVAYLLQTGALGLAGALVGAGGGVLAQWLLPRALDGVVPAGVEFALHWPSILLGLGMGTWVAIAFALPPLLRVRGVPPIRALRREATGAESGGIPRLLAYAAIAASVAALGIMQAGEPGAGLAFTLGIGVVLGLLWLTARLLIGAARRFMPRSGTYPVRQGISNLFRPRNQTLAVTLALGFGVFLIGIIFLAQHSILDRFRIDAEAGRPNLLFFDLQPDQEKGVDGLLKSRGAALEEVTPLVPGRIAAIGGKGVTELLGLPEDERPSRWALRREYRNTYRAGIAGTERVVAGRWWGEYDDVASSTHAPLGSLERPARISVEADLASELGIGVGDRVRWDFHGVELETVVASLREVDWAQFAPNFFVVFEPGVLEEAPHTLIALARMDDPVKRAELQRDLVLEYPNVSVLDLTAVQSAVDDILGKVGAAVRVLALFAVGVGVLVLIGALRATRTHRLGETRLLRTLGAGTRQIRTILLTEYLALGALAGAVGLILAALAAWPLLTLVFGLEYRPPIAALVGAWLAVMGGTAVVGGRVAR